MTECSASQLHITMHAQWLSYAKVCHGTECMLIGQMDGKTWNAL